MTRKHLWTGTLAIAGMAMIQPAHAEEGVVTVAGYDGIFSDHYVETVIEGFREAYPDIEIDYYPMTNSAAMLGMLRAQQEDPLLDVVIMDVSVAKAATDEGLTAELDPSIVTNLEDLYPTAFTEGVNGPAVTFDNLVLMYNTEAVEEPPTSWEALWDEQHDGMVTIPAAPDIQGTALTIIANKLAGGAPYTENLDAGVERLAELAPHVQTWDPSPDPYVPIMNGSANIGIGWNARGQIYSDQSEGAMKVVIPEEGSIFQINTINLVANSPDAEAAQTFINYALSPEAQAAFTEAMFYAPTNSKAQPSEEAMERTAATPERMESMMDVNWLEVAEFREDLSERWRREIISQSR